MCRAYKWRFHTGFFMRNSEIGKSALTKQSAIHLTRHPSIHPIPSIFRFWPLVYGAVRERKRYSLHAHSLSISNQENVSRCLFKVSIYLACNWWDTKREGWSLGAAAAAHTTIGVSTRLILGTTVFVMYPVVWTDWVGWLYVCATGEWGVSAICILVAYHAKLEKYSFFCLLFFAKIIGWH